MSEHENPARQRHADAHGRPPEPHEPATTEHLTSAEKSLMRRFTEVLRFADFLALLMVAATAFSAYAAWRTAQVTSHIFAVEERPFIGIERVTFERGDTPNPRAVVEYRNFGKIPASGASIAVTALADGRRIAQSPNEMSSISAGMLSPGVRHFFYTHLPVDTYKSIVSGKVNLMIDVRAEYKGPGGAAYCYTERVIFDYRSTDFRPAGGTDRCGQSNI